MNSLRMIRAMHNDTEKNVALAMWVSVKQYKLYERGIKTPSQQEFMRFNDYYNINTGSIYF